MRNFYTKSLLTALLLLCSAVASAQSFESNGISYSILSLSDRTVEVAHNANYQGFIIIPSTADYSGISFKVTGIGNRAFSSTKVTEMIISEGVTHIGDSAFYASTLKEIIIPNCVTSIGEYAFSMCTALTSITIPNSVTSIENYTFEYCTGLTSITIPNSVTSIGDYAFKDCIGLTSITIGNSVTTIGEYAFYYCPGLTSITIPNSVTEIKYGAFSNCTGLASVTIGSGVTSIEQHAFNKCNLLTAVHITDLAAWCNIDFDYINYKSYSNPLQIAKNLYINGKEVTNLVIPNGVKEIKAYAFYNCTSINSVTIPNSVISIGEYAFDNCDYLTAVHITDLAAWCNIDFEDSESNPLGTEKNLYINGKKVTNLVIPNGIKEIKAYAFEYCTDLTSITIPNSVTSIGNHAFCDCDGLTSVTIPNSVTSIGNGAFGGCTGLTSVTIPNSVIEIGDWAFSDCSGLTSITIPNSVTSIGNWAFENCSGLTSVTIGNSVTSIGNDAFYNCRRLSSVTIPNSVTSIGSSAFENCTGLASITIGNSVTSIGSDAFYNCTGLANVTIGNSVTSIGLRAFYDCTGLTSIIIPNSVTWIGDYAFNGCTGLAELYVKATEPPTIYSNTFNKYTVTLHVPAGTKAAYQAAYYWRNFTNIEEFEIKSEYGDIVFKILSTNDRTCEITFKGSTYDEVANEYTGNIVIPEKITFIGEEYTVTSIAANAFSGCTGLKSITIPNSVTSIGDYAFKDCKGLTSVTIGNSVKTIGINAFYNCTGLTTVHTTDLTAWCKIDFKYFDSNPLEYANNLNLNGEKVTNLVIPNGVTKIKPYTFNKCTSITSVTIPNSVTSIDVYAFYDCTGLTSVTIPNSVTSIGEYAFYDCTGLTSVTIPNSVTLIEYNAFNGTAWYNDQPDGVVYAGQVLYNYKGTMPANTSIIIKEGTLVIAAGAFSGTFFNERTGLTSITIPNSVTSIGSNAFGYCTNLTEIYVKAATPPTAYSNIFYHVPTTATLYVPTGSKAAYQAADYWNNFTNIIEMDFCIKGDITGDESVDVGDITTLVSIILDDSLTADAADVNSDGSVDVGDITEVVNIILNPGNDDDTPAVPGTPTDSRAVDLGLSVKWASCNVGAIAPEEYGGYYAWGETEEKNSYEQSNYIYYKFGSFAYIGYDISGEQYDVAHVNWGGEWRMPTLIEIEELLNNCTWTWTTLNGVNGYRVTGPNGNSIFLPAAGYRSGTEINEVGSKGFYWSSLLDINDSYGVYGLYFYNSNYEQGYHYRCSGQPVRPVCE